ncbi:hypothetical protein OJ22_15950 [Proteus mirabilis]|uniref:hypothetical protein n=1 Tax=Proteus mirabilis TaxID=584 RepID=UPI00073D0819|nr:hypothetical protein [Proteus mirabilis]EMA1122567.1 hypothetical protein [Proteus mirabilis]KSW15259.1 hypothetical protein OJ22_15950 [Proteus mirabilis]MDM3692135.1 hypothetical protein [Proteus mirabilis]MDW8540757.1 hypothetical protein [Proteus mirabilis]
MKLMKILILDDNNIELTIDRITKNLQRAGIELEVEIINPQSHKFKDENNDIDFLRIKEHIIENHTNKKYDVISCDFSFSSEKLNGYLLIKWIINSAKSNNYRFKNAKFICYSGEENKFKDYVLENDEIIKLIKLNIHAFYKRDSLSEDLTSLLKKINENYSPKSHIVELLNKEPEKKFKHIYPKFEDKKLGEIANEIDRDSHHGIEFQKYITELTYSHILELNKQ